MSQYHNLEVNGHQLDSRLQQVLTNEDNISQEQQAIAAILLLIPSAASELNKLADKSFVNSSIATSTATFRGTYNMVEDLELTVDATHEDIATALLEAASTSDCNDYAFVQIPTSDETPTEIRVTERYKFDGEAWQYEYDLNNSGFTSDQWEAINSGITSLLTLKLAALPTMEQLQAALNAKQEQLTFDDVPTEESQNPVKSGGIKAAIDTAVTTEQERAMAAEAALENEIDNVNRQDVVPVDTLPSVATADPRKIYRVVGSTSYTDYMVNAAGDGWKELAEYTFPGVDNVPTAGSNNLAKSGGIAEELALGAVFDVTAHNSNATFASLNALLSDANLNTLIPTSVRKGGMSIKFVQTSDNKYVQYRLMSDTFNTTVSNWQGVDDEPKPGSKNLVYSDGIDKTKKSILDFISPIVEQATYSLKNYSLTSNGKFGTNSGYKHAAIAVMPGETYVITNSQSPSAYESYIRYCFATSDESVAGGDIPLVSNTSTIRLPLKEKQIVTIPDTCTYLLVNYDATSYPVDVKKVYIDEIPTEASRHLITSGAVEKAILMSTTHIGLNSSYSINNAITNYLYDVRKLEKGKYFVALHKTSGSVVNQIKLYRTTTNVNPGSSIIGSPNYDLLTNGTQIEIEITEETNYLWFYSNSVNTYDAEFYLVKSEYAYSRLVGKIDKNKTDILSLNEFVTVLNGTVDSLEDKVDDLYPTIPVDDPLPIYRTDTSKFINNLGNLETYNSYSVIVYDVTNLTKVKIVGKNSTSTVRAYGFYSSDNIGNSTLVGSVGPAVTANYEYELDVPATAKYLACTKYDYQTLDVTKEKDVLDITKTKEIKVENGNKVTICIPSANRKLIVVIGPTADGIANGLIDFRYWGYSPLELGLDGTRTKLYDTDSDCFGPFQIFAKSNIDGDDLSNTTFTGGSHRYNNGNTGSTPTARLGNVDIRVDGVSCETFEGKFSEFEIQWEAYVQATNTKKEDGTGREVLKQVNTIKYVDGEFRCSTELIPLEDITLHLWYGYQCVGINPSGTYSLSDHWKYVNAVNRGLDSANSGLKDTIAMIGYTDKFEQQMWVDTTIDMGKREMYSGTSSGAFKDGDKGYFRIANNDATLTEGYHYYLYGKYVFTLKEIS